jgi:hypothetical protein
MKIAIFGDSYADDQICWKQQWQDVGPSWVDYLKQYHEVENFSLGGSCLYYSKKKFDSTPLEFYDKIIFVVTESIRRYQLVGDNNIEANKNWNYETSLSRKEFFPVYKNYLETIHNFFVYMHNESDEYFHQLMVEDIIRKRKDVMILYYHDLLKISTMETNYWAKKGEDWGKLNDARKCHMSGENNLIFGKMIRNCLEKGTIVEINLSKFVVPTKPFKYYFRKL